MAGESDTTSSTTFDVAVIGRGMIGAAAARHLAESGHSVVLIGPGEPARLADTNGPFASHWDEGRITRLAARDRVWAELARRSIGRYADIAERSGISFHQPRGLAIAYANAQEWAQLSRSCGGDVEIIDADELFRRTGIFVPAGGPVALEGPPAGFVNPRRLVAAQTELARRSGAVVVEEAVSSLTHSADAFSASGLWGEVRASRVLLATGAFGQELLNIRLHLTRQPRTVVLAEFDDGARLPSLLLDGPSDPRLDEIYWVPPVRYPDGRVCLKIGGEVHSVPVVDPDLLPEWFHNGGSLDEIDALRATVRELLPDVTVRSWASQPCVITRTPSTHPFIGWVEDGIAVAIGGNGSAAKSSDELGRLAAELFRTGEWIDEALPAEVFSPVFAA